MTEINSTVSKASKASSGSHNFIFLFSAIAAVILGFWQDSILGGLFLLAAFNWYSHQFAYVVWDGRGAL